MANYIISLMHSHRKDQFITLWRPDDAGYCYDFKNAGIYPEPKKGYHDSDINMPIAIEDASKLAIDYHDSKRILNVKYVWDQLGVKMTKHGLQFKKRKEVTNA